MGAKLVTYYRKKAADDEGYVALVAEADKSSHAWQYGQITPLGVTDPSPFRMGNVKAGERMLVVENAMATAAAAAHSTENSGTYLLIRRTTGQMYMREISSSLLVRPSLA